MSQNHKAMGDNFKSRSPTSTNRGAQNSLHRMRSYKLQDQDQEDQWEGARTMAIVELSYNPCLSVICTCPVPFDS